MESLQEAIEAVERRRKVLEVYTAEDSVATALTEQFSTRNVDVRHRPVPAGSDGGFVVVRTATGEFGGALGLDHMEAMLSPTIHPPWALGDSSVDTADLFDFLDNTVFTAYDRAQMLATSREIENRAWRRGNGRLYVGFQRSAAFETQLPVYGRLVRECDLEVRVFVADERDEAVDAGEEVVSDAGSEIGRFWFVLFDGGGDPMDACGLVAVEHDPGRYRGFWTYDPERVEALFSYVDGRYVSGGS